MDYRFINRFEQSEAKFFEKSVSGVAELCPNSAVPQCRADETVRNDIAQVVKNHQTSTESLGGIEKILEKHSYTKKIIASTEEKSCLGVKVERTEELTSNEFLHRGTPTMHLAVGKMITRVEEHVRSPEFAAQKKRKQLKEKEGECRTRAEKKNEGEEVRVSKKQKDQL